MKTKNLVFGFAIFGLVFTSCNNNETVTKDVSNEKTEIVEETLSIEERAYLVNRLEELSRIHDKLVKSNLSNPEGKNIGKINREIREIENPEWFSKNIKEIRYIKLIEGFITEIGIGIATTNDDQTVGGLVDYQKYSDELKELLKE